MSVEKLKCRKSWVYGDRIKMSAALDYYGIHMSPVRLNGVFSGRTRATPEQAVFIERVARGMGYAISRVDCVWSATTDNPLFKNGVDDRGEYLFYIRDDVSFEGE